MTATLLRKSTMVIFSNALTLIWGRHESQHRAQFIRIQLLQVIAAWLILCVLGCSSGQEESLRIQQLDAFPTSATRWQAMQFRFEVAGFRENPFDPEDIDVRLELVLPDGTAVVHPAFFQHEIDIVLDHDREVARDTGNRHWEVRWTPTQIGEFKWTLKATSRKRTVESSGSVSVKHSLGSGFVVVSDRDPRYFETSDGEHFRPIGHCTRSPLDDRWVEMDPGHTEFAMRAEDMKTFVYDRWFEQMRQHGANSCVIWMTPWWLGLEWSPTRPGFEGLGHYNQIHAAQLDRLFRIAEEKGIRIFLYIMNHGQLSTVVDAEWDKNPYNKVSGGGLVDRPADFLRDPQCKDLYKKQLRYIIARWGYSTALMGIGLCTESNWVEPYDGRRCDTPREVLNGASRPNYRIDKDTELVVGWLAEMSRYIKEIDIHGHVVSTQFSLVSSGNEVWPLKEIEVTLNNCYSGTILRDEIQTQLRHPSFGTAEGLFAWAKHFGDAAQQPLLVAEWGGKFRGSTKSQLASDFHCGNWALAMTICAGPFGFWWCNEVEVAELYRHYEPLSLFLSDDDPRGRQQVSSQCSIVFEMLADERINSGRGATLSHPFLRGLMRFDSKKLVAYVYHELMSTAELRAVERNDPRFPLNENTLLELPDVLERGRYRLEFWDTFSGNIVSSSEIVLPGPAEASRRLQMIPIRTDIALKMEKLEEIQPGSE